MFRLSFITPTAFIKDYQSRGDFVLALSHLIDLDTENDYEREIKKLGLPIWLDNGAFEKGFPEGIDNLLRKSNKVKAKLVFAPDYWEDAKKTRDALQNFFYIQEKLNIKVKVGVVIQASNWKEFLQFYEECLDDKRISVIGINHYTTSKVWQFRGQKGSKKNPLVHDTKRMTRDRIDVLKFLDAKFKDRNRNVHLLGLGGSYKDVIYAAKNFKWVISNDTSASFMAAYKGVMMDDDGDFVCGKIKEPVNFDLKKESASAKDLERLQYNIDKIKSICHK